MRIRGKIAKRTMSDPNEFTTKNNTLFMKVYDGKCRHIATIILDIEDYDKVKDRKWSYNQYSDQVYSKHPGYVSLKRTLLNIESRRRVVFKNKNKRDFRKHNLYVQPISPSKKT